MNSIIGTGALTALLFTAGCGNVAADTTGSSPGGEPPALATPATTLALIGGVTAPGGAALADADVCVLVDGSSRCTRTGADGAWTLGDVPKEQQILLTFEKAGFIPMLEAVERPSAFVPGSHAMRPDVAGRTFMGTEAPAARGQLEFAASPLGRLPVDVSVTLTGADGRVWEPQYLGPEGTLLAAASSGARGGFAGLPTGDYVLTFTGSHANCMATDSGLTHGYLSPNVLATPVDPSLKTLTVVVPIIEGYVTGPVSAWCERASEGI